MYDVSVMGNRNDWKTSSSYDSVLWNASQYSNTSYFKFDDI